MTSRPLGVGLVPMETRRDVILRLATRAEELGYTSFSVAEGWGHDAAVLLTEIACRTERIRLAAGVLNGWGRSPATIALLAPSLAQVSGGRFTLGLGAGSPQLAEGLHDVPFRAPVRRLGATGREGRGVRRRGRLTPAGAGAARRRAAHPVGRRARPAAGRPRAGAAAPGRARPGRRAAGGRGRR